MAHTNVKIPIDTAVSYISKGIHDTIKEKLKKAFMEQAEQIVEEISLEICRNLKTRLVSFEEFENPENNIKICLYIDRELVKEV